MRFVLGIIVLASVTGIAQPPSAHAIGCISGGLAGAAAGHLANHGILGAIGGCIAGHQLNKHQQRQADQRQDEQQQYDNNPNTRGTQINPPNRY